jgi:hypothetical protein
MCHAALRALAALITHMLHHQGNGSQYFGEYVNNCKVASSQQQLNVSVCVDPNLMYLEHIDHK